MTAPHLYDGGERKLHQIGVRCLLGEKSRAKRQEQAAKRAEKTGRMVVADEWEYSVLIVCATELEKCRELSKEMLVQQLHFYDKRATIELRVRQFEATSKGWV